MPAYPRLLVRGVCDQYPRPVPEGKRNTDVASTLVQLLAFQGDGDGEDYAEQRPEDAKQPITHKG